MAKSRLIGDYPVIGIRPTIDGRRGPLKVRESLEEQTMNMAKSAAELFRQNIRYSNGEPVKVIIADTTIGRVAEAAACADKFRKAGVDITLTVTPCWCYGSETMDMDKDTIKGVWGFNGTERPGAVYLAAVLAAHAQKGLPAFGIYGKDVQEADATEIPEDVKEKLLRFGRAAVAAATMRGKSWLQIGSICMGIAGCPTVHWGKALGAESIWSTAPPALLAHQRRPENPQARSSSRPFPISGSCAYPGPGGLPVPAVKHPPPPSQRSLLLPHGIDMRT